MPEKHHVPFIMVGPGTGVVPFVGFMQDKEMLLAKNKEEAFGHTYLFFGCRRSTSDFIYREELNRFKEENILNDLFLAFSRDNYEKRVYVSDLLREQKDMVVEVLLNKGGYFYICGSMQMGHDVQNVLKEHIGEDNFKVLEKEKRLVKELWG